ncbi:hypothetical protein PHLCEN_2v5066 [Hermanssonia centrifuga]|uniref:Uncharacterized protein n=1 Tax=Hermanssonia centrifuga TaxID=98765 RepID=A0A2R6PBV7_9APHY|nr:hypothetical protein PHLCEN_2v5066 [Hermanssonia centrifuga]
MDISFASIERTVLVKTKKRIAQATFFLSQPPTFYLEDEVASTVNSAVGTSVLRCWTQCHDWTENNEGSTVLQHEVLGPYIPLNYLLKNIILARPSSCPVKDEAIEPSGILNSAPAPSILGPSDETMSALPLPSCFAAVRQHQ